MSIYFTTGATVTFHELMDHIVAPPFLDFLQKQNFKSVTIQYGNEISALGKNLSKEHFSKLLAQHDIMKRYNLDIRNTTNDKSVTVLGSDAFTLTAFAYADDVAPYIAQADLVVSHAGTGSIMDVLRSHKPLVAVTNDSLMAGHQAEVALQFAAHNYLKMVLGSSLAQGALERAIEEFANGGLRLTQFPESAPDVLGRIISEECSS